MKKWLYIFSLAAILASCSAKKQAISSIDEPRRITSEEVIKSSDKEIDRLISEARKWIGTPYVYGGNSRSGTDCSGLIMELFKNVFNIKLPRSAAMQHQFAQEIERGDLNSGDLVFFCTGKSKSRVNHVGLYIGKNKMIHASSSRGVMESDLGGSYWQRAYYSSGRIVNTMPRKKSPNHEEKITDSQIQELYDALDQTIDSIYVTDPAIFD